MMGWVCSTESGGEEVSAIHMTNAVFWDVKSHSDRRENLKSYTAIHVRMLS
jgi:hypothetical protein